MHELMIEQVKEVVRELIADDELFAMMAKGMRKLHLALVAEGFTEEQAAKIVATQGMGSKAS